ncbi:MAG: C45 family autoproteolytic acyltransferase/hydrolase [Geminicoccaceae bacterium]
MELTFKAVDERRLGPKWQAAFARAWPGWRAWYLAKGGERRLHDAGRQLRRHMPELVPVWQRQVELAGDDEVAARFLTFWNPPAYLVHCSQAVLVGHSGPFLVRNYDLDPDLSEATILRSAWTGRDVVATMEAIAGAADGVNASGLAVSLAFGGRQVKGTGFGVPLIVRYLLETCERTRDAVEVLRHIPSHMSYNVTVVDRAGDFATVFLAPDRPVEITRRPLATNHQGRVEWAEQARFSRTEERAEAIEQALAQPGMTPERLTEVFLRDPVYAARHAQGFGTVYTAAYRPAEAGLELRWPGEQPWRLSCASFREGSRRVRYAKSSAALPPEFADLLAGCLRRPQAADWAGLGRFWITGFPQFAG